MDDNEQPYRNEVQSSKPSEYNAGPSHANQSVLVDQRRFEMFQTSAISDSNVTLAAGRDINVICYPRDLHSTGSTQSENKLLYYAADAIQVIDGKDGFLGAGTFGIVRAAKIDDIDAIVAIKLFDLRKECIDRIQQEMEILHLCSHNNVVQAIGFVQKSDVSGIVMEYMCRKSLSSLLYKKDVTLSVWLRCRMCHEVARGIAYFHNLQEEKRVAHGDLKLENILLCNELHCKISDFGSARISAYTKDYANAKKTPSSSKAFRLTELYAAPERLNDPLNNTDEQPYHDVYSYSVIATELIGWKRPSVDLLQSCIEEFKMGGTPHLQTITFVKEILQKGDDSSNDIINGLIEVIENCRKFQPFDRWPISKARDILDKCWTICDENQIKQDVREIINKLPETISSAAKDSYSLVSLNKLLPNIFSLQPTSEPDGPQASLRQRKFISRIRGPISDVVETETMVKIRDEIRDQKFVYLHCVGLPGGGKSQIVRNLGKMFPFNEDEKPPIKWHIQGKVHDVKEQLKELAEALPCIFEKEIKNIKDDIEIDGGDLLVNALLETKCIVLIVEDLKETSTGIKVLRSLVRSLKDARSPDHKSSKIHVYMTSRKEYPLFSKDEFDAISKKEGKCDWKCIIKPVDGFNQGEAVDFLLRGKKNPIPQDEKDAAIEIYERCSGFPLLLKIVRNRYFESKYRLYLVEEHTIPNLKRDCEAMTKEYESGDSDRSHPYYSIMLPLVNHNKMLSAIDHLHWDIMACLSYLHEEHVPDIVVKHFFKHMSGFCKDINTHDNNAEDLIRKLVINCMCSRNDSDISFVRVVLSAFAITRLAEENQAHFNFFFHRFNPLKLAISTMLVLDLKGQTVNESKLRKHIECLDAHAAKDPSIPKELISDLKQRFSYVIES